ncbi:hypothetical protein JTE90_010367 [Oedothorax gibbosus]|uniref:Uncharacterized protein n=1 Tax=Oedothorax gibbosus TaxID=931172 RepID=A0AAV6W381_9ARAC|nr:hypothetical protein JTE90_010367 [Oedothorax gibbosus]
MLQIHLFGGASFADAEEASSPVCCVSPFDSRLLAKNIDGGPSPPSMCRVTFQTIGVPTPLLFSSAWIANRMFNSTPVLDDLPTSSHPIFCLPGISESRLPRAWVPKTTSPFISISQSHRGVTQ